MWNTQVAYSIRVNIGFTYQYLLCESISILSSGYNRKPNSKVADHKGKKTGATKAHQFTIML